MGADEDLQLKVVITGRGELLETFRQGDRAAREFGQRAAESMRGVNQLFGELHSNAQRAAGAMSSLGFNVSLGDQARGVIDLRDAVTGLAASAGMTGWQIDDLREKINDASTASNQFGRDMTEALNTFVAKTGDIQEGTRSLELFGRVARATRSSASDIASVGAELQKLKITDQGSAFAALAAQSDVGAVELKDLVSQGPRLISAFQSAGLTGERGLREGGALAQVYQMGTGNVERTSTAVEATFRDIAMKRDKLEGAGIGVAGRDRVEVLQDIIRKTKGDEFKLREVFGDEAYRGVAVMANEYRQTGGFGTFEKFRDVKADSSLINRRFIQNSTTTAGLMRQRQIEMEVASDRNLGNSIESVANGGAGILSSAYQWSSRHPLLAGAGALGAGLLGRRFFGGAAGGALGAIGSAVSAATGSPIAGGTGAPVQVTNWPQALGGGGSGGLGETLAKGTAEGLKRAGQAGALKGLFGALGLGGAAAIGAGVAGGAAQLGALAAVVSPLNQAMPQIRGELEAQLRAREEHLKNRGVEEGKAAGDLIFSTTGRFGGAITSQQAFDARRGYGAYGRSASEVTTMFGEQQLKLRQLAAGERRGVDEGFLASQIDGGDFLMRALQANPEFAKAKPGKERAKVLEQLIAKNAREAETGTWKRTAELANAGQPAAAPSAISSLAGIFGIDAGKSAGDLREIGKLLGETIGITINLNVDPTNGTATVDAPGSARKPEVLARRTVGGG